MDKAFERLFELFRWNNRDSVYRVRFRDGDEYELRSVVAGQDYGAPPHASAAVVKAVKCSLPGGWPKGSDMFLRLPDIIEVTNASTGELLYRAA